MSRFPCAPARRPLIAFGAALLLASGAATAEKPDLDLIMSDPLWIGDTPESPYWSADGSHLYYERALRDEDDSELVRLSLGEDGSVLTTDVVADGLWGEIDASSLVFSEDHGHAVFVRSGDVFVREIESGRLRQLTRSAAREFDAFFLAGEGLRVAFQRDGQFFVRDLESGLEWQPAEVRLSDDPEAEEEKDDYLSKQQPRLLEVIAERQSRREKKRQRASDRSAADPTAPPEPFFIGEDHEITSSALSPDARALLLVTAPAERDEGRDDQMPVWVTEDGYVEVRDVRPKVGTAGSWSHSLVLLDAESGTRHDVDLETLPGIFEDPLAEIRASREDRAEPDAETSGEEKGAEKKDGEDDPSARDLRLWRMSWSPDGARAAVQAISYDNKDRWLFLVGLDEKEPQIIERLTHEGWINWSFNEFGWVDADRLWFLSEQSGWSQLYLHTVSSGTTERLTRGQMVVQDPQVSADERHIYFVANDRHPGRYDVHRVDLESGTSERLTSLPAGRLTYGLSPAGDRLWVRHSVTTRPPELYVQEARAGAPAVQLTRTVSERFTAIDWVAPQIVEVPSSHQDRPVYSRFYPARNAERLRGAGGTIPAVVFVHGAGYLQNSHMGWSNYFREFMFHTLLAEHGYHVLDMDYRGSAGYGADWRMAIYRHMGQPELEDLQDGVRWLVDRHGVDASRVGVYGGSYGGFMTLMALFKDPDLFAAGAALRPVTDWAHYNHPYTSNILNTPDVDPLAYERSSPIEFAEGLEKPLLMCAPMLDDNVFFQDTVRLAQKLIELEKKDWEVAVYPVEPHGFRRPSSWLDEYRRIFELFEEHLATAP
ncbi:MAG: prolyl oligopeptidase family serine peptidase [Acidobacteriota bacterium]